MIFEHERILTLHSVGRKAPKVPGMNAQPLQPSIGTDHWRISASQKRVRNAQIRKAAPFAGIAKPELITGKRNGAPSDNSGGKAMRASKKARKSAQRNYSPYGAISLSSGHNF